MQIKSESGVPQGWDVASILALTSTDFSLGGSIRTWLACRSFQTLVLIAPGYPGRPELTVESPQTEVCATKKLALGTETLC